MLLSCSTAAPDPTATAACRFVVPGNPYDKVQLRFDPGLIEVRQGWHWSALHTAAGQAAAAAPCGDRAPGGVFAVSLLCACYTQAAKTVAGLKAGADPAPWQQGALRTLGLVGEGANTEVSILRVTSSGDGGAAGGGPVEPRLLAAVRVLCARSHGDLMARGRQQPLTAWDAPLQPLSSEVRSRCSSLLLASRVWVAFVVASWRTPSAWRTP